MAEQEFASALALKPDDVVARELRGRQRELRRNIVGALEDYDALIDAADRANASFYLARAYRLKGDLLAKGATRNQDLDEARDCLNLGLTAIEAIGSLDTKGIFERGLLNAAYARVQEKRKKLPTARKHLAKAIDDFKQVDDLLEARAHRAEATRMLRELSPPPSSPPKQAATPYRVFEWLRRLLRSQTPKPGGASP